MRRRSRAAGAAGIAVAASFLGACERSGGESRLDERGRRFYEVTCAGCHGADGRGREALGPPLDGSSWVTGPPARLLRILLHGVRGLLEVKGRAWNQEMPGFARVFDDAELAALASYLRAAWANRAPGLDAAAVAAIRAAAAGRGDAWTAAELLRLE